MGKSVDRTTEHLKTRVCDHSTETYTAMDNICSAIRRDY